jgi:aspartokinase/homoserine dehydrogenase 1
MKILKFGGSSLETPERITRVVDIVHAACEAGPAAVVVSAFGGVTDALSHAADESARGRQVLDESVARRHLEAIDQLATEPERGPLREHAETTLVALNDLLHGVSLIRECSLRTRDVILSHGERLSALVVAAALRRDGVAARVLDARQVIVTDGTFGGAHVQSKETERRICDHFAGHDALQVVTGFIAATADGETTTLGRGGSDYTAALLGAALGADSIEIWTDVPGVMSADPRLVADAFSLKTLSYDELMELSHFGAKVVFPFTVHPARARGIPLVIRNTLAPEFEGTTIVDRLETGANPVRGISSIHDVALLRLEGDGMVGVPGIAGRLFGALAAQHISVILISQGSSEHSICFAVIPSAVPKARAAIHEEFALEREVGLIDDLVVEADHSVIAAVGEGMRDQPGVAGRVFDVLGSRGINVHAIAQGSSELNISFVIDRRDEATVLNAVHDAFFGSKGSEALVYLVGTGRVGAALQEQIEECGRSLDAGNGGVAIGGRCNTREMTLRDDDTTGPPPADRPPGQLRRQRSDLAAFVAHVIAHPDRRVLVDCTASETVAEHYEPLLEAGVPVVTANKKPLAGSFRRFQDLELASRRRGAPLLYETTVGAGLPVLGAIRSLRETGDRIRTVSGVFSGTIAFLLDQLRMGTRFSDALREAHERGYTEPDPREDLSGADVMRKLVILARVAGASLEPEQVVVEPMLLDSSLATTSIEEFWDRTAELDPLYRDRQHHAAHIGRVLGYVATWDGERASVGFLDLDPQDVRATLGGTDNVFVIHSERYRDGPLVIRGPGAGPTVTAAGVFSDVLQALAVTRNERAPFPAARIRHARSTKNGAR